jgi:hypothetical protein
MGNSIQLQWTDQSSISRTATIYPNNIKYAISGQNIKVQAKGIKPYTILMGYNNPSINLTFKCDSSSYDILNTLTSDLEITVTVNVTDFPEFLSVSTKWYSDKLELTRGQSYGSDRFDGNINLIKTYE